MPKFQIHASFAVPQTFTVFARIKVDAETPEAAMQKLNSMSAQELSEYIKSNGMESIDEEIPFEGNSVVEALQEGRVSDSAHAIEVED